MKKNHTMASALFIGLTILTTTPLAAAEPLELRKIMQDMGAEMAVISEAISREQWTQVERSALQIADHPRPPMSERMRIKSLFGSEMGRFKSYDIKTHSTARELAKVAASEDGSAVIATFATLQSSCLTCHQNFRKPFQHHFYGE